LRQPFEDRLLLSEHLSRPNVDILIGLDRVLAGGKFRLTSNEIFVLTRLIAIHGFPLSQRSPVAPGNGTIAA